jgi:dTDP-4-dehydrorhamnose 3,5-epimerase
MTVDSGLKLQVMPTAIPEVLIVEPKVFGDNRGWFTESFNAHDFSKATGLDVEFVQDNHSFSRQWTLRGMHDQLKHTQGKLVRVLQGSVIDVAVDIRPNSLTYGQHFSIELNESNKTMFYIPPGFAHGFLTLSKTSEFLYKVTSLYKPDFERSIVWNDPILNISWPSSIDILTSPRDKLGETFARSFVFE